MKRGRTREESNEEEEEEEQEEEEKENEEEDKKFRSRPVKPNQRKGQNEKFMNFAHFVNSGVFPQENKHDSHWTFVPECPREKFMNWPFFGLVCRGHS